MKGGSHKATGSSAVCNSNAGKSPRAAAPNLGLMLPFVSFQTLFLLEKASSKGQTAHRSSKATGEGNSKDKENEVQEPPCPCLSPRLLGWRAVPGPLTWGFSNEVTLKAEEYEQVCFGYL